MGTPPNEFEWEYLDSKNNYVKKGKMTPLEFYKNMVPFKFDEYVCVVNDPRTDHKFNKTYTVKYLGNVVEGNKVKYLNLPIENLKDLAMKSINDNEPVWFGCDVGKWLHRDECSMDLDLVNYKNLFDVDFTMNKEERLLSGDSLMTHAMVLTGYSSNNEYSSVTDKKKTVPTKWQVENSWSTKGP